MNQQKKAANKQKFYERKLKFMSAKEKYDKCCAMEDTLEQYKLRIEEYEMLKIESQKALETEEDELNNLKEVRRNAYLEKGISSSNQENMKKQIKIKRHVKESQQKRTKYNYLLERKFILESQKVELEDKLKNLQQRLEIIKAKNMQKIAYLNEQKAAIAATNENIQKKRELLNRQVNEEARLEKAYAEKLKNIIGE